MVRRTGPAPEPVGVSAFTSVTFSLVDPVDVIRYAVVGCAGIGPTHAEAVETVQDAELVACADVDADAATEFADEYDCAAYTDTAEMVAAADVDALSVCTPSGTHADVTV